MHLQYRLTATNWACTSKQVTRCGCCVVRCKRQAEKKPSEDSRAVASTPLPKSVGSQPAADIYKAPGHLYRAADAWGHRQRVMDSSSSSSSSSSSGDGLAGAPAWQLFQQQRLEDLRTAHALAQQALLTQRLPKDVPPNVAYTAWSAAALSGLALVMLHPRSRRLVLDVAETVLATVLVLLLLVIVLGLPFGAVFIFWKGIVFVVTSLLQYYPQAQEALDGLNKTMRASWG